MTKLTTARGKHIQKIGLGSFPLQGEKMRDMALQSFSLGYGLIDTADDYRGETGIGLAVERLSEIGLRREDVFLQTKISCDGSYEIEPLDGLYFNRYSEFMKRHSVEEIIMEKVDISLREMKTDYIDSLLIHLPYEYYFLDIWNAMIKCQNQGKVRYIGVSNFHKRHIEMLKKHTGVTPQINEIYISPIGTKEEQIKYAYENGIVLMTYSPLMDVAAHRISEDALRPIIDKYNKSLAQVVLRWNIERGCIPLPKTQKLKRLKENCDIFDFSLTKEEVDTISSLNYDFQYLPESKICPGL